jgi:hypothetical protein
VLTVALKKTFKFGARASGRLAAADAAVVVLMPRRRGALEHLTDLLDARAAAGPSLTGLTDLLERAGPTTHLIEYRTRRDTLAETDDHDGWA